MKMHFKDGIHEKNIIVRCAADRLLPFALTFGIYIIIYGTISPGGGFQGGVTVASAILFLYLASFPSLSPSGTRYFFLLIQSPSDLPAPQAH